MNDYDKTPPEFHTPTPKPVASPVPPQAAEGKTNPGALITAGRFKHQRRRDKLQVAGVGLASLLSLTVFIDNRVKAQTDGGTRVIRAEVKGVDARVTTLEKRADRTDAQLEYLAQQNNAALDALHVPARKRPVPVPPLDAGQP